jgi:hypothetical protein
MDKSFTWCDAPTCSQLRDQNHNRPADPPFSLPTVTAGFFAGAWAGLIAETLLHPFDTISTRLKAQVRGPHCTPKYQNFVHTFQTIVKEEGVQGLYGGIGATLLFQGPATAIYFGTYEFIKKSARDYQMPSQYEPLMHLTAGAVSEIANSCIIVPMEVVKTRMQLGENPSQNTGGWIKTDKNYRNTMHAIASIVKSEGLSALYSGYRACLVSDCVFSALQFAIYEQLKKLARRSEDPLTVISTAAAPVAGTFLQVSGLSGASSGKDGSGPWSSSLEEYFWPQKTATAKRQATAKQATEIAHSLPPLRAGADAGTKNGGDTRELSTAEILLLGAVAGGTAALITNPLDVVTARLMAQRADTIGAFDSMGHCFRELWVNEGVRGLFSGSVPRVLSIAPLVAIQFGVYEAIKEQLGAADEEFDMEPG